MPRQLAITAETHDKIMPQHDWYGDDIMGYKTHKNLTFRGGLKGYS